MTWAAVAADFQLTQTDAQAVGWANVVADCQQGLADVAALGGGPVIDSRLVGLAANTALDLGSLFPTMTVLNGEFQKQTAQIYANGGCAYDSRRAQVVVFAGGHAATNYDAVLRQQLSDLALVQDYEPTPSRPDMTWANYDVPPTLVSGGATPHIGRGCWLADLSGVGGPYPRPAARHTGAQILVVRDELILFGMVEGNAGGTEQAWINDPVSGKSSELEFNCLAQIAHYSLPSKTWDFENTDPPQSDGDGGTHQWGAVEFDPVSGMVIWIDQTGLYTYDPAARRKTKVIRWSSTDGANRIVDESGAKVANTIDILGTLCYRTADQTMYYFSRGTKQTGKTPWQPWRLEIDRSNFANSRLVRLAYTGQTPQVGTPISVTSSGETPIRYDTANDVFGSGPWANTFYVFDPKTKAWSHQTINGDVGSVAQLSHMLAYSPEANVYWLMTDQNNTVSPSHTWAYRYR